MNLVIVKIRKYRQDRKESMRGMIRKMYDNGTTEEIMTPIFHLTHAMENYSDNKDYSNDNSRSSAEWYG